MVATDVGQILMALQAGLALDRRPFAAVAHGLSISESQVLTVAGDMLESGRARRLAAIFEPQGLGMQSALCALRSRGAIETAAAAVVPHQTVTHCYQRDHDLDLWFTISGSPAAYARTLAAIAHSGYEVLTFPQRRRFKIGVVLPPQDMARHQPLFKDRQVTSVTSGSPPASLTPLTEDDHQVIDRLMSGLPVVAEPFAVIAAELGLSESAMIGRLRHWQDEGRLRRIALICHPAQLGYRGNIMAAWAVPEHDVAVAGHRVAAYRCVSHCYERIARPEFPYNLFAMIHQPDPGLAAEAVARLSAEIGHPPLYRLPTLREFKKTGLRLTPVSSAVCLTHHTGAFD